MSTYDTRAHMRHYRCVPSATSNTAVHAAVTLTEDAQSVTTAITNPDVPRALIVKGNASEIAGDVVITGTNARGETITETIALSGSSAVSGNKAFATVTSFTLPAKTNESGDTVSIGWNDKLGIPAILARNTVLLCFVNGTREGTLPTVTVGATLELNTFDPNSALAGTPVDLYWIEP